MTIRVILADEQPIYRLGLQTLLARHPGFSVLADCADGEQAVQAATSQHPDILLLDLNLPKCGGIEVLERLHEAGIAVRSVILTARMEERDVLAAIRLGVRGVVLKDMPAELVVRCLRKVHDGGEWLEQRSISLALERLLHREHQQIAVRQQLTAREMQLAILVAQGLSNREVADQLFIGEGTVKAHLHKVYEKLKVRNRVALSKLARESGWL